MPHRILVVDDDKNTCVALAELLQDEGHTVEICHGAQHALALLEKARFDVLITDFMMSGMNGLALVHAAKAVQGSLRCLMMSGHRPPASASEHVTWIEKPVELDQLIKLLES